MGIMGQTARCVCVISLPRTTLQYMMNAQLSVQKFWDLHKNTGLPSRFLQYLTSNMQVPSRLPFTLDQGLSGFIA